MPSFYKYSLFNHTLLLTHERCIFWEEEKALILSDLHFGKIGHFRKSGIPLPQNGFKEDLFRLLAQVQFFKPRSLIIVGDMFHSHQNMEMELFLKWRRDLPLLSIHLVKGNHDILSDKFYRMADITTSDDQWLQSPFCFTHDIALKCNDNPGSNIYTFSGHIHPGIRINGIGKQSLKFPCFYFSKEYAVLPAFSKFTGLASVRPKKEDKIFALVENSVVEIHSKL